MAENLNPQGYNYGIDPVNTNPFWGNGDESTGVTFIPTIVETVRSDGVSGYQMSWENDGGLPNPEDAIWWNGKDGQDAASVVANPDEDIDAILTKLKVGNEVYGIPSVPERRQTGVITSDNGFNTIGIKQLLSYPIGTRFFVIGKDEYTNIKISDLENGTSELVNSVFTQGMDYITKIDSSTPVRNSNPFTAVNGVETKGSYILGFDLIQLNEDGDKGLLPIGCFNLYFEKLDDRYGLTPNVKLAGDIIVNSTAPELGNLTLPTIKYYRDYSEQYDEMQERYQIISQGFKIPSVTYTGSAMQFKAFETMGDLSMCEVGFDSTFLREDTMQLYFANVSKILWSN